MVFLKSEVGMFGTEEGDDGFSSLDDHVERANVVVEKLVDSFRGVEGNRGSYHICSDCRKYLYSVDLSKC